MIYTAIDKLIQALFDKKTVKTECKTIINKERKEKLTKKDIKDVAEQVYFEIKHKKLKE